MKKILLIGIAFMLVLANESCKQCKKEKPVETVVADSTSVANTPINSSGVPMLDLSSLPKADSVLIPLLAEVLDEAFVASAKKDYATLAPLIVYRGDNPQRTGYDVFNIKNNYEKNVVRITGETLAKWNTGIESRDYARAFEMPIPDGRSMPVLEVIFIGKKSINRKFFAFLEINGKYRISDITSYL